VNNATFNNLNALKRKLLEQHKLHFCDLCIKGRKVRSTKQEQQQQQLQQCSWQPPQQQQEQEQQQQQEEKGGTLFTVSTPAGMTSLLPGLPTK
jgi:hypothetical protein